MEPNINQTPIQENQIVTPTPPQPAKSSSKLLPILLAVLLILIVATVAYVFGKYSAGLETPATQPIVTIPTTAPTLLPTTDPTAGWKTYTNEIYEFSFKYPKDTDFYQAGVSPNEYYKLVYMGKKQIESGRTQSSLGDGYMFNISVRGLDSIDKVTQDTFNGAKLNCYEQTKFSSITETTIDNRIAKTYSVTDCMGDYTEYFVSNGKTTFEITRLYTGVEPEYSEYKEKTDQILSTFKFME